MLDIHKNPRFEREFVSFWSESYEAALDDYLRTVFCGAIDEKLHVPFELAVRLDRMSLEINVAVDQAGQLIEDLAITQSSGVSDFDELARETILIAAENFKPLPQGSAHRTEFKLRMGLEGPIPVPNLWREESRLAILLKRDVHTSLLLNPEFKFSEHRASSFGLVLNRTGAHVQSNAASDNVQREAIRSIEKAAAPVVLQGDLPNELRFIVRLSLGTDILPYKRELRGIKILDRLDIQQQSRRRWFEQEMAKRNLEALLRNHQGGQKDPKMLQWAIKYAKEAGDLDMIREFCAEECTQVDVVKGYRDLMHGLFSYARLNRSIPSFADEIQTAAREVLSRSHDEQLQEEAWSVICCVLAEVGNYDDVLKECRHITNDQFQLHQSLAFALERAGRWHLAMVEWKRALDYARYEGDEFHIKQYIQDCEDQIWFEDSNSAL